MIEKNWIRSLADFEKIGSDLWRMWRQTRESVTCAKSEMRNIFACPIKGPVCVLAAEPETIKFELGCCWPRKVSMRNDKAGGKK